MRSVHKAKLGLRWVVCCLYCAVLVFGSVSGLQAFPDRLGDLDEDGLPSLADVVAILNHIHGRVPLAEDRIAVADLNRDGIVDVADADAMADAIVRSLALTEIDFTPALDPVLGYTQREVLTVSGKNFPFSRIRVSSAFGTSDFQLDGSGLFALDVALPAGEVGDLYLAGYNAIGEVLPPEALRLARDTEPPLLDIIYPPDNFETAATEIRVAGVSRDVLSGHLGVTVSVNGSDVAIEVGDGLHGSFLSDPIPLVEGSHQIVVRSFDGVGNETSQLLAVSRINGARFQLFKQGGDFQIGTVGDWLEEPVVVSLLDPAALPVVGKPVLFEAVSGGGSVTAGEDGLAAEGVTVLTDEDGEASVRWRLGAAAGNHLLRVSSQGVVSSGAFVASARPRTEPRLHVSAGDQQFGLVGAPLAEPLRVWVSDGGNALAGQEIRFEVLEGGGLVNERETFTVRSGQWGFAEVVFRLGPNEGRQRVGVGLEGEVGNRLEFHLDAVTPVPGQPTSVGGILLTPFLQPIDKARIVLLVEGVVRGPVSTTPAGEFRLDDVLSGPAEIRFWLPEGHSSQLAQGRPVDRRKLYLVEGRVNQLPEPIILPMTLNREVVLYDGASEVLLPMVGNPDYSLRIPAGGIRSADGKLPTPGAPYQLSLTQIPCQYLPYAAPLGERPRLAWLLEPSDIQLRRPASLVVPAPAGAAAEGMSVGLFGIDHRKQAFERFATLRSTLGASARPKVDSFGFPPGFAFINAGYRKGGANIQGGVSAAREREE